MQPGYAEIKRMAKYTLKNKWPEAIAVAAMLISLGFLDIVMQGVLTTVFRVDVVWTVLDPASMPQHSIIASICITVFSMIYGLLVFLPFSIGALRWFWFTVHGEDCSMMDVFYYFTNPKRFFKAVFLVFLLSLRAILGAAICLIPYIIINLVVSPEIYNFFGYSMPVMVSGLFPLIPFFEIAGIVLFLFWCARYVLFFVPLFTEPEFSANKVIKQSIMLTKGKLFRFMGFLLGFLGWLILCLLMLPMIFVVPYGLASLMVYGREELRFSKVQTGEFQQF